ncbi:hypothetical protein MKW98_013082 [Papaver atlanticum]|uniref:Uncharacterized protein n=1 Tax=Papaver atlanticum TaxID=357466 RepID=A0AAD4XTD9_9MAGN|nr:hypothetical protein MKW98_013082 [Papaver atlanticum]
MHAPYGHSSIRTSQSWIHGNIDREKFLFYGSPQLLIQHYLHHRQNLYLHLLLLLEQQHIIVFSYLESACDTFIFCLWISVELKRVFLGVDNQFVHGNSFKLKIQVPKFQIRFKGGSFIRRTRKLADELTKKPVIIYNHPKGLSSFFVCLNEHKRTGDQKGIIQYCQQKFAFVHVLLFTEMITTVRSWFGRFETKS